MDTLADLVHRIRRHSDISRVGIPLTHVALVVDKSGSMESLRSRAVTTINEQIQQLKAIVNQEVRVTLITFNGFIDVLYEDRPIHEVSEISLNDYVPTGSTALNDALRVAIESIRSRATFRSNEAFLVVAVTDGMENQSITTTAGIKNQMEMLQDTRKWTFSFMISNINERDFISSYAAAAGNVCSFTSNDAGLQGASGVVARGLGNYFEAREQGITVTEDFYDADNK